MNPTERAKRAQQRKAARALARGASYAEAAKAAGCSPASISRWRRTPEFEAMLAIAAKGKPTPEPKRPGKPLMLLQGFRPQYVSSTSVEPWWTEGSPAARLLAALRIGSTWELAGHYARMHEATGREWNSRGAAIMATVDSLEDLTEQEPDPEQLALAAFHVAALEARNEPTIRALETMTRSAGSDWRAADRLIARLPKTREIYAEVHKSEISGPGGGPIELAPAERVAALLERARAQREAGALPDREQGDVDGAGEG